jgi:ABC-type xylose transport system permease subunit
VGWLSHDCNLPLSVAIVVALLVGALCGWVNGLLVTRAKLPAFIATLSMMTIARGLANIITDGRQIVGYPDWFDSFATVRYFGFLSLNQQKAIIARWISRSPKVFMLDEPTRGIDMGARAAIYETIAGLQSDQITMSCGRW